MKRRREDGSPEGQETLFLSEPSSSTKRKGLTAYVYVQHVQQETPQDKRLCAISPAAGQNNKTTQIKQEEVREPQEPNYWEKMRYFQIKSLEIDPKEITLGKKLGEGHNGVVYEGVCRSKKVAVKVCNCKLEGKRMKDFLEEIQIMA